MDLHSIFLLNPDPDLGGKIINVNKNELLKKILLVSSKINVSRLTLHDCFENSLHLLISLRNHGLIL